jgi:hypothetical protein
MAKEEIKVEAEPQNTLPIKYVSVEEKTLMEVIEINKQLRAQVADSKADLANIFLAAVILSKNIDFKKPWKAIAFFTQLINNPDKFKSLLKPVSDVLEKHEDLRKQIEAHYDKMQEEAKTKK